jgi:microcystin-dependent protein
MPTFPLSPTVGQTFQNGLNWYQWNGTRWVLYRAGPLGPTGPSGPTGTYPSVLNAYNPYPIGSIIMLAPRSSATAGTYGSTINNIPNGFIACDATSYTWAQYTQLRDLLLNTYGGVNGVSWNVPDLRDRVPLGRSSMSVPVGTAVTSTGNVGAGNAHNHRPAVNVATIGTNEGGSTHSHGDANWYHSHSYPNIAGGANAQGRRGNTNTTSFAFGGHQHSGNSNADNAYTYTGNASVNHAHTATPSTTNNVLMSAESSHAHTIDPGTLSVNFAIRAF